MAIYREQGMPRLAQDVYLRADVRIGTVAGVDSYSTFQSTVVPIEKQQTYGVTVSLDSQLLERDSYVPKEVVVREIASRMTAELRKAVEAQVAALFDSLYQYAEKQPVPSPIKVPKKFAESSSAITTPDDDDIL